MHHQLQLQERRHDQDQDGSGGGGPRGSFADMIAFMREEREHMKQTMDEQRRETEQQRAEMRAEMKQQRQELTPSEAISAEQLATLQARLEAVHQAKLLSEAELFVLEDICADYAELKTISTSVMTKEMVFASPALEAAATLYKLVGVSEQIVGDAAFARQAWRKFVA
eukprot:COSAG06_NODE_7723_length_2398_cov_5.069161_2_plen_168_part_00